MEKKNENKICKFIVPGDNLIALSLVYIVSALMLTSIWSLRFYNRFGLYGTGKYDENGQEIYVHTVIGFMPQESSFNAAISHIFIGTSIFILFCILMVIRNYLTFHMGSQSIYLMKRIHNPMELHIRCLTLPVLAIIYDALLTAMSMGFYYNYYCRMVGVNCSLNLWEALL